MVEVPEELLEKWKREDEEAKRIRREHADWSFIKSLPPKLRYALEYYVETGDDREAARIAGMGLEEFTELRIKARIPRVL